MRTLVEKYPGGYEGYLNEKAVAANREAFAANAGAAIEPVAAGGEPVAAGVPGKNVSTVTT